MGTILKICKEIILFNEIRNHNRITSQIIILIAAPSGNKYEPDGNKKLFKVHIRKLLRPRLTRLWIKYAKLQLYYPHNNTDCHLHRENLFIFNYANAALLPSAIWYENENYLLSKRSQHLFSFLNHNCSLKKFGNYKISRIYYLANTNMLAYFFSVKMPFLSFF